MAATLYHNDPRRMPLAFGDRAIPKLMEQLDQENERMTALVSLSNVLHDANAAYQAIENGLVAKLLFYCQADNPCCIRATQILSVLSSKQRLTIAHAVGRKHMLKPTPIASLSALLQSKDKELKRNVLGLLCNILQEPQATEILAKSDKELLPKLTKALLERVEKEEADSEIVGNALETLYPLNRWNPCHALEFQAMKTCALLLRVRTLEDTKYWLGKNLTVLCMDHRGKQQAVDEGILEALVGLLMERKSTIRASAASAIMSITVNIEAKRIMAKDTFISPLIEHLYDTSEEVVLYLLQTIANCAEDYRGRYTFQNFLSKLEELKVSPNPAVGQAAERAIKVIKWRP